MDLVRGKRNMDGAREMALDQLCGILDINDLKRGRLLIGGLLEDNPRAARP